ncbi:hypothetical protein [Streptomyces otsuchiensis]|uniref:hypothetical protein n=1 Tax=Streptomyces otsuchiensis TaxID=2681388 RepID=UPI00102FACD4|nr:hypothetical protein [Streptomyces otsuchiensis]
MSEAPRPRTPGPRVRASTARVTADRIRIGDFLTLGGEHMSVTFAEHRGGLVRLELDASARLTLAPTTALAVTRPVTRTADRPATRAVRRH